MDKLLARIKKIIPVPLLRVLRPPYHFCLSWLAAVVYRFPGEKLIVVGVTGTTGKTTSVYLISRMLARTGYKVGFTSTAAFNDGRREWLNDKKMTMVGRFFTQKILRQMVKNGCQYAIVETTSEGIVQFRHRFINYDILVFTGLYPEHIESHGSFANYKKAKGKLFTHLKRCRTKYVDDGMRVKNVKTGIKKIDLNRVKKTIIANGDDQYADYFLNFSAESKFVYAKKGGEKTGTINDVETIRYDNLSRDLAGFVVNNIKINLRLLGEFNAVNAMAAVCVGLARGMTMEQIKAGLESVRGVPGRLEAVNKGQSFAVIVDYAYEPKAVIKLYETVKSIPHRKIIHVLGSAGGGRDAARRRILGRLAGERADYVVVTNEDPYDDDPGIIISQVALGAEKAGKKIGKDLFKILDRREALRKALSLADVGDLVLITGKGSEQAICVAGGRKIPWDDRKVVEELLNARKKH